MSGRAAWIAGSSPAMMRKSERQCERGEAIWFSQASLPDLI
jgi:hypothetical protein